jgi:surface polysaccharide O-acyltransferase-like enzyme
MFGAFHYVSGFIGYMLLGFWFRKFAPRRSWPRTLAAALPLWLVGVAMIGIPFFTYAGKFPFAAPYSAAVRMEMSIEYCSLGVALATIAAFTVVRKIYFDGAFYRLVVRPVSEASYGMYLVHMLVLTPVSAALIPRMATPLAIISSAAISYVASALLAIAVRRVPVIGKWVC